MGWRDISNVAVHTADAVKTSISSLQAAWRPTDEPTRSWAAQLFDLEERDLGFAEISDANLDVKAILHQYEAAYKHVRDTLSDHDVMFLRDALNDVHMRVHLCYKLLLTQLALVTTSGESIPQSMRPATEERDGKKKTAFQRVLLYVLDTLKFYGYRRCGDACYWELKTPDNIDTHAFDQVCTIAEFVQKVCGQDEASDMWDDFFSLKCSIGDDTVKQLMRTTDARFPELKANRYLFSFRNGLYNAEQCWGGIFFEWANKENWEKHADECNANAVEKGLDQVTWYVEARAPTRADVAIKYFNCDFPVEYMGRDPSEIPTDEIERILNAQGYEEWIELKWIYGFLGRNLFPIGIKDKWQKIMFVLGESGSGKSTICNAMRRVWPASDVASLGHEDKFQLMSMYKKLHWQCTEVRRDHPKFLIEHVGDVQDMWAGGDVPVAIKGGEQKTVTWTSHGMLCGNEVMKARDARGSIVRRLFMVNFDNIIDGAQLDPHLDDKIFANMGHFILKINKAYSEITNDNCDVQDIVLMMGAKFQMYRDDVVCRVDSAHRFFTERLSCGIVHYTDLNYSAYNDIYMKWNDFTSAFNRFLEQNGLPRQPIDDDTFKRTFYKNCMKIVNTELPYENQASVKSKWLLGVGYRDVWDDREISGGE
jgi:energy-coupling factor transporter ATP-binding protein EcfA2